MTLTVFIPDFERRYAAAGRPRLLALERMVARGQGRQSPVSTEFLAPIFGLEPWQLTPGPFMRLGDGGSADSACWFCAGFVHLAPDRDQLVLMPESVLHVTREEAAALAAAFNTLYGAEGWKLEADSQGRAYLRCPQPLDAVTHDPEAIAGQPVLEYMPVGADATRLKQLMNEIQMLFHTHPVNVAREEAGQPLINSLWLWGGGVLPKAAGVPTPKKVLGDSPLLRGLSLWAGIKIDVPSIDAIEPGCLVGLAADDVSSLEKDWFASLFTLLKSGKVQQLSLYLGGFGIFEVDPAAARRFWRSTRPLVAP
jgi:hypothetical protein